MGPEDRKHGKKPGEGAVELQDLGDGWPLDTACPCPGIGSKGRAGGGETAAGAGAEVVIVVAITVGAFGAFDAAYLRRAFFQSSVTASKRIE